MVSLSECPYCLNVFMNDHSLNVHKSKCKKNPNRKVTVKINPDDPIAVLKSIQEKINVLQLQIDALNEDRIKIIARIKEIIKPIEDKQ